MAGGEYLSFNNDVFLSERETADRNYSLAYHMKEKGAFPKGFRVQECMDFYFKVWHSYLNTICLCFYI